MYEPTKSDLTRGRKLKAGAIAAPVLLAIAPASITFIMLILSAATPPVAAVMLFLGVVATILGFAAGLIISAILFRRHTVWTKEIRERIAADGIKAEELDWFRSELKPSEKKALKAVEARDLALGDAYRETLASRLTATRIVRSSKKELSLAKRRQTSLRQLNSPRAGEFMSEIEVDLKKLEQIEQEAKLMLVEAESRLQMIEAAVTREGSMADSELALRKLTARTNELPLALEAAKLAGEIRKELESNDMEADPSGNREGARLTATQSSNGEG